MEKTIEEFLEEQVRYEIALDPEDLVTKLIDLASSMDEHAYCYVQDSMDTNDINVKLLSNATKALKEELVSFYNSAFDTNLQVKDTFWDFKDLYCSGLRDISALFLDLLEEAEDLPDDQEYDESLVLKVHHLYLNSIFLYKEKYVDSVTSSLKVN